MFGATWSWLVPVLGALAVFAAVLLTTPPGFAAIGQVVFLASRGPNTDAAAFALGAAASLGLVMLIVLGAVCGLVDVALRHKH